MSQLKDIINVEAWKNLGDIYVSAQAVSTNHNQEWGFIKKIGPNKIGQQVIYAFCKSPEGAMSTLNLEAALHNLRLLIMNQDNCYVVAHYRAGELIEVINGHRGDKKEKEVMEINIAIEKIKLEHLVAIEDKKDTAFKI